MLGNDVLSLGESRPQKTMANYTTQVTLRPSNNSVFSLRHSNTVAAKMTLRSSLLDGASRSDWRKAAWEREVNYLVGSGALSCLGMREWG